MYFEWFFTKALAIVINVLYVCKSKTGVLLIQYAYNQLDAKENSYERDFVVALHRSFCGTGLGAGHSCDDIQVGAGRRDEFLECLLFELGRV